jgi:putative ABC transport system permease protein
MNLLSLVFVNLFRNPLRTLLTMASIAVALFLFCALGGVLDTLGDAVKFGSESRLATRNAISLVFPMPLSYRDKIAAVPGIRRIAVQNWFGGRDPVNPHEFFAQFAVDPENFFPMYRNELKIVAGSPPQAEVALPADLDPKLAAFMAEQTGCVVNDELLRRMKWTLGQTIHLDGTIYPGSWPFTIRAVFHSATPSFGGNTMLFHFKYLEQNGMGGHGFAGVYKLELENPDHAADIARQVDALFENSSAATHTETERAFAAGFVSMYGNIPFVLRLIGLAVVFAILLVAANTMVMAVRERTSEVGVLKTLGFADGTVFTIVLLEAAVITLGGGILGSVGAKLLIDRSHFNAGGALPPMTVHWSSVRAGIVVAAVIGAASGLIPAWQSARLRIVDALRRVD